ncbi:glucose-6-phosphate dehydrogenase [Marinimicrobium alkaliphilum]|uniref:glucose-6-phosphate dehydrogenase n=1 Tax=Marinimicrobium alkaliphilum TaxID=2202654 RepID=UPI000DBAC744|nr:glucose-6-phosphate dehydrogenase [Marinimicrobium alkaliphilum]
MLEAFDFVIFGGAGDLAQRKLIPAMYRAHVNNELGKGTRIVPTLRKAKAVEEYQDFIREAAEKYLREGEFNRKQWDSFAKMIHPKLVDIASKDEKWDDLAQFLKKGSKERVFYLATPPGVFGTCCKNLSQCGLITDTARVVVEKPLGYDLESAEAINSEIGLYFNERQIFRIDHYLGKETVQNLLALRFTNGIFEHLWDAKTIDNVQISISETVGLEGRAGFYDGAGALRDMVQNHLLQLLCLVAMESPNKLDADDIRAEKIKVLKALRPLKWDAVKEHTVRGQYVTGKMNGKDVPGYLDELGEDSTTETFVAIRAHIDNWRWAKVPFYLRTGKRMKKRCAEIIIQYKDVSHRVYPEEAGQLHPNRLVIRLQPEELMQVIITSKDLESTDIRLEPVVLNLNFADTYKKIVSDAYKRLIMDAAANDPSLFIHRAEVNAAWRWIDPIIEAWQRPENKPHAYEAGSWGPEAAEEMLEQDGRSWFNVEEFTSPEAN